tara:strand:- start:432 stop:839 length:408 start_codon:yes stop_codon:yes gene_type:complete
MRELCSGATLLYGDYDLLINQCLKGNVAIKEAVAKADNKNSGGLKLLIKELSGKTLTHYQNRILYQCMEDQNYFLSVKEDTKHITITPLGKYRVRVQLEHNRLEKTFSTLKEAQDYRDKVLFKDYELKYSLKIDD